MQSRSSTRSLRELGELGDNVALRARTIAADVFLRARTSGHGEAVVLGHTRWASVGIISEANARTLNQEETDASSAATRSSPRRSTATSTTTPT